MYVYVETTWWTEVALRQRQPWVQNAVSESEVDVDGLS